MARFAIGMGIGMEMNGRGDGRTPQQLVAGRISVMKARNG